MAGASAVIVAWSGLAVFLALALWRRAFEAGDLVRLAPPALVLGWAFAESSLRAQAGSALPIDRPPPPP